jgi:hypothetical protein
VRAQHPSTLDTTLAAMHRHDLPHPGSPDFLLRLEKSGGKIQFGLKYCKIPLQHFQKQG